MSVFVAEVARPALVFRGLLGQAEPILITGGRAVADYREVFVIDVAKLKNAIAVAESGREGEIPSDASTSPQKRLWGEIIRGDRSSPGRTIGNAVGNPRI